METTQAFREKDLRKIQVLTGGSSAKTQRHPTQPRLYEFDEGDTLSFDEGTHGVLVIGGVGRGKTASFMLPMASSLIENGLPGLIIDIKNNFTDQIRKLAKAAGREDDIIEIGTHPSATPINILAGLSLDEMHQLFESLIIRGMENSRNIDWLHKGIRILSDVAMLLHYVSQNNLLFVPNFVLLDKCINDYEFARTVFKMYLDSAYDAEDYCQRAFVTRVQTSAFHIFTPQDQTTSSKYEEQLAFQLYTPRLVLGAITSDNSLCANLSGMDCSLTLDYRELLKNNKIVLLRFKHTQGHAAKLLARLLKEKYYADIYRTLDQDYERPKHCFFMADEYQDVINVSPDNTFDDFSWFSKAREFGCINVVASQALSSLYANSSQRDQVNALVANCSTKIVLQNDDPAADAYFRHFCGLDKTLAQLGAAEALVSRFDLKKREQTVKMLHCSQAFKQIQAQLVQLKEVTPPTNVCKSHINLLRNIDTVLQLHKLPRAIKIRPDYLELTTTFKDLFEDLDEVKIRYREGLHSEVMDALKTLHTNYSGKFIVNGIIEVDYGIIYLDINSDFDVEDEIDDFVRELLEKGHEEQKNR